MAEFIKIGHRGAMGHAPENTPLSIQKALELKVDMLEIDVFVCKSEELVVIHNNRLSRTTNGVGYVHSKTLEELKQLDAGEGQSIPTLSEVLDLVDRKAKVNIELKGRGTLHKVVHTINRYVHEKGWSYNDFLISSFHHARLKKVKKANPLIPIGVLARSRISRVFKFARKIQAISLNVSHKLVYPGLVAKAHGLCLKVYVWTVNDPAQIKYFKSIHVDGIISDFPDRL